MDKFKGVAYGVIDVPEGGSFDDMLALIGNKNIGENSILPTSLKTASLLKTQLARNSCELGLKSRKLANEIYDHSLGNV
ncbi:MAG: hypothetical protein M1571_02740 [Firmicutes bacterium]|nr:hypothetical protein [Bacillota bacterium]